MTDFLTLDDLQVAEKTVILRLDVNSPIKNGRIAGTDRLQAASATLAELLEKKAKVVVLAHQGRKGDDDYTSLGEHAQYLARFAEMTVTFTDDLDGDRALSAVRALKPGEAVVLENVRSLEEETRKATGAEHATTRFVSRLSGAADYFVCDAFSAAHRSQASLVGFPQLLPSAAGRSMERELKAIMAAVEDPAHPNVYYLGGSKPEDSLHVMRHNFAAGSLDKAIVGGLVGELFLVARGHDLGTPTMTLLEKRGVTKHLPEAEKILEAYDESIITPSDLAMKGDAGREEIFVDELPGKFPIYDIGEAAVAEAKEIFRDANSIMVNGPAGLYEEPPFDIGARGILKAVAESKAVSLIGGGHTTSAIKTFGMKNDDFGYVSLAGGALMAFITGEKLPAVVALEESKKRFGSKDVRRLQ
ncbi:MAG: phosphoglycerate kinase [Euryarchaeota archaeon]|nr:phosphoglycerate kinase [Euryarchaeota archaeon]